MNVIVKVSMANYDEWKEAFDNGFAPKVYLKRTNRKALSIIDIETLKDFAIDLV